MTTFNVSFPKELLRMLDAMAKAQSRSRSELLRHLTRQYAERRREWEQMFAFGRRQAERLGLKPEDVNTMIADYRRRQTSKKS